ncbi:LysR family transcriptional regulator [Sphingomonas naphthae]|uniref:LysR family transcriptional regulator n=1 Tax=Sphingomonas naphthae TaxID=1813468 RepID=A0ABY7TPX5_9SPHN|nr:LysR family transcriptional regulator [Sphingomonas naphthae]WCT74410.1 LysR family transcriptional regulator [Sphingomonas naphthae]
MELRHIRYFLAVAEARNFTRAAQRLGIGQPPLSQQIRDLEDEIGVRLFHRIPQGAELTEAGHAFLAGVRTLPDQVQAAVHGAQRAGRGETGALRVGFTGSAAFNPVVPGIIRAYRRAYPDVELSLQEGNSLDLVTALRDDLLDAAFLRPESVEIEGLQLRELDDEAMVVALPSAHRLAGAASVRLADLATEAFVLTPRNLGPTLFDAAVTACREVGFEPQLGQSAPQIASVLALVAAELGVSLVPASMRKAAIQGVTYCDLADVRRSVRIAIACRRTDLSPAVRHFYAEARAQAPSPAVRAG